MSLESVAYFRQVAANYGIQEGALAKMQERGWDCMGKFAFSCSVTPNAQATGDAFLTEVAVPILGGDAKEDPQLPALRRLYFEAWMVHTADLKYRIERRDDDPPRKMPSVEKEARKASLRKRLGAGLQMTGDHEPADCVIDMAVDIYETQRIKCLAWEKCISKDDETDGVKVVPEMQVDKNGFVKIHGQATIDIEADISNLTLLSDVLARRGMALDIGTVLSWEVHAELAKEMVRAIKRKPLPGWTRTTFEQVKEFDKEVWRRASEEAKCNFKMQPGGIKPLDAIITKVMGEDRTARLLVGRQGRDNSSTQESKEVQELKRKVSQLQNELKGHARKEGGGAGGSSRVGTAVQNAGGKRKRVKTSAALKGMDQSFQNKPICFAFNMEQQPCAGKPNSCEKGVHICGGCKKPNCAWVKCLENPDRKSY